MKKINDSLTEEELIVLRDKGTERAFSGKFDSFYEDGTYKCKNCGVIWPKHAVTVSSTALCACTPAFL